MGRMLTTREEMNLNSLIESVDDFKVAVGDAEEVQEKKQPRRRIASSMDLAVGKTVWHERCSNGPAVIDAVGSDRVLLRHDDWDGDDVITVVDSRECWIEEEPDETS